MAARGVSKPTAAPVPSAALVAGLREMLVTHERRSSAVRPEVVGYLVEHGLAPLHAGLAARGETPDALCAEVWRLMLASVEARRFGVSSDAWTRNEDYPDRYFPLLWLGLVPQVVPPMAPGERLPFVTALFNLGEQLGGPLRATANRVMGALGERLEAVSRNWRAVLEGAMVDAGLLAVSVTPPSAWQRVESLGHFDFATVDAALLPEAVETTDARGFRIGLSAGVPNSAGTTALLLAGNAGLSLLSLAQGVGPLPAREVAVGGGHLRLDVRRLLWAPPGGLPVRCLQTQVPALVPAALAANLAGDVLLLDAVSARVFLGRLVA